MGERRRVGRSSVALVAIFTFFASLPVAASPWGRANNEIFLLTRVDYFSARGDFLASTPGDVNDHFQRLESNNFFEFGVTDKIMIGGKALYGTSWVSNDVETITASGFSEFEGFAQRQLWKGRKGVGAVRIAAGTPKSFDTGVRRALAGEGASAELRFLYGRNLREGRRKIYTAIEWGYRHRFGDAADQAIVDVTLGIEPAKNIILLLQSFNKISIRNETDSGADFDLYRVQPSIVWRGGRTWSLEAGLTHEYAGRNFTRGDTFFVGLWTYF